MRTPLLIALSLGLASFGLAETSDEAAVRAAHEAFVKAANGPVPVFADRIHGAVVP